MNVVGSNPASESILSAQPTEFTIDFTHAYDLATLSASDLTVNGLPADRFVAVDDNTVAFRFDTSPVASEGPQPMQIAAGSIQRRGDGNPLAHWIRFFYYDTLRMAVSSTSPSQGELLPASPGQIILDFNEAFDPASIDATDLALDYGVVTGANTLDSNSVSYTVTNLLREGAINYALTAGSVLDFHGTPGPEYRGSFAVDDPLVTRFASADIPKQIPDRGTVSSSLTIETLVTIVDLDVKLSLTHSFDSDLDVFLIAPEGRRIELFTDVGGVDGNFLDTTLDDEANVSIAMGRAPFTGYYRPEGLLSAVDGHNAFGAWTLEISDDGYRNVGALIEWSLIVTTVADIDPRINSIHPLPLDGSDVWAPLDFLTVRFSEAMDAATINDVNSWQLIEAGADGVFGGGDDSSVPLSVSYTDGLFATLIVESGDLPVGSYRLTGVSGGLRDKGGRPLDGNGDGLGGDNYVRYFTVKPRVTAIPFVEGFEAGSNAALGGYWEFVAPPPGRIVVGSVRGGPHNGTYHLQMEQIQPDTGPQFAILHLDLVGRSGLSLDFWENGSINGGVQISPNGTDWHEVVNFFDTHSYEPYVHHAIDLDRAIAAAGFPYTRDFQIRFTHGRHAATNGEYYIVLDDIRVSQLDVFGPRVLSHSPNSQVAGPIGSFTVTFDEPIDAATFLVADVTINGPLGSTIALPGHPVDSGDHRTFTINLAAPQTLTGNYTFRIDSDVRDLAGNPLNQDGDTVAGETNDQDDYLGAFEIGPPIAQTVPYVQGFESGDIGTLGGWSFAVTGNGTIEITNADSPHGGAYHLKFDPGASSSGTEQAVLVLDLSEQEGRTDLALDFWLQAVSLHGFNELNLHVSGDGSSYVAIPQAWHLTPSHQDQYTHYAYDLDAALAGAAIALDGDVYLRFTHRGTSEISEMTLDEIRVGNFDVVGPRVLTHSPLGEGPGPINQFVVTFDEPIDESSFTADDVTITGPVRNRVALASDPQHVGDRRTFIISLARTQELAGNYSFKLGPEVGDLAGNLMNQDSDPALGETNGEDQYVGTFQLTPVTAQSLPYVQDFESGDIGTLAGWNITVTGNSSIVVTNQYLPHSGAYHLRFARGATGIREAALLLDLSSQAGRTDLELDFWLQSLDSFDEDHYIALHVSGDGVDYVPVPQGANLTPPPGFNQYTHYAFDLDAAVSAAGVAMDGDVYVRIKHAASGYDSMTLDYLRISNLDVFGPKVLSHSPSNLVPGPVSSITVTFDEPMDAASFTAADVTVTGPSGATVALAGNPVDSGDQRTFTINLAAAQGLIGNYSIRIGADVRDLAGNPLNQDGDPIAGETNGQDGYAGGFEIGPLAAQAFPYAQGFESGDIGTLSGWKFQVSGGDRVFVTSADSPHGGSYHLKFDQAGVGTQQAILLLDLLQQAGRSDLSLDFWMQAVDFTGVNNFLDVHVSGDGINYALVPQGGLLVPSDEHQYLHYVFDFDAALSAAGIATDGDVYLRFTHTGSSIIHDMLLDDIRVGSVDVHGPKVVSHLPSGQASLPLNSLSVTFDEEIDAATFTAADVSITGPAGNFVTPASDPVDSGDRRTFTIPLGAGGALAGNYSLRIGPDVRNLAGHAMNQDGDPALGETNGQDSYAGTFEVGPPAARSIPYSEGFESGDVALLSGWGFEVTGGTQIEVVPFGGHGGSHHLRFDPRVQSTSTAQSAIVALDLSKQAGSQDVWVDFWLKRWSPHANGEIILHASGDGVSYVPITGAILPILDRYTHYAFDLDAALTAAGVALDSDVYLMFRHSATNSLPMTLLDDLRITDGPINQPPTLTAINTLPGGLEDHPQTITYEALATAANEADIDSSTLSFIVESVSNGTLTKNGIPVVPRTTLLSAGEELVWTPGQSVNGNAVNAFLVTAWDGELDSVTPVAVTVAITPVNDAPSFRVRTGAGAEEDSTYRVALLVVDDIEPGPPNESGQQFWFQVTNDNPSLFSTQPGITGDGRLGYALAPNAYGAATLTVVLRDNGGTENGGVDTSQPQTLPFIVHPVNDAPLLDNSGHMSLEPVTGGDSTDNGNLVSAIIASAGGDRITDVDAGALEGIAVTNVDNSNGSWQYSIDNGGHWADFGAPSVSMARLLAADDVTSVRFVPYVGLQRTIDSGITFRGWDRSGAAANGGTGNTTSSGGITPFSVATETASITVYPFGVQVIDDSDPAGFELSGDWAAGNGPGVGRNDTVRLAFGESFLPTDSASWTFDLVAGPGRYRVLATWFTNPGFSDLFTDRARFEISDSVTGGVRGTSVVNQKQFPDEFIDAGSAWEVLGEFDIVGSTLLVRLFSSGDNQTYVVGDAIRVERIADLSPAAEIQVIANGETGVNVPDESGHVDFGTTDFKEPVTQTFTISNTGAQPLTLAGPVSVTGSVFEIVAQPARTTLDPGQSTTFQVRMNALVPAVHIATVSFANNDGNENPFNFTVSGTVLSTNIIDDQEPGFFMSPLPAELGGWGQVGGTGRPGTDGNADWVFNINRPGIEEFVTWTFDVTPGVYRVSTTWAFQHPGYDDAAPFTIFDGTVANGTVVGGRHINQQAGLPDDTDYAPGFGFPFYYGSSGNVNTWEGIDVVHISGNKLTVLLAPEDVNEYVLADSILIDRLGDLPAAAAEIVVTTNNRAADKVDFGTTELHRSIDKTFTIRNTGTSTLNIGNITNANIGGANFAAFEIVSGPSSTAIPAGGTAEFVVRLTAAYPGVKNATITLTTNDPDEPTVILDLTGNVNHWHIIDDGDAGVYSQTNMASEPHGLAYRGDHNFANKPAEVGPASATWTFTNVSPGIYYVALTWIPIDSASFASNAQLIVQDGLVTEADVRFSQRNAPGHFPQDGANWQYIVFGVDVSSPEVTVTLTNDSVDGYILADGAMLIYIADSPSMPPPPGNSESLVGQASGLTGTEDGRPEAYPTALNAPSSTGTLRAENSEAVDQALLGTAYWTDELDEVAMVLAEDSARESDELFEELVAAGRLDHVENDAADPELTDLLE